MLVGPEKGKSYPSKHGIPAVAGATAAEVSADDFAAVIVPSGYSPGHMRRTPGMIEFLARAGEGAR